MKRRDFLKTGAIAGALGLGATPVALGSERGFQGIKPTETVTLSYLKELSVFPDCNCMEKGDESLLCVLDNREYMFDLIKYERAAFIMKILTREPPDGLVLHMKYVDVVIDE